MDSQVKLSYLNDFIDHQLIEKLRNKDIDELFPVQIFIIPLLVNQLNNLNLTKPHDICVSSPTGSGKTYTFCLPIIQFLSKFVRKELRVLIILPVTDLAQQIFQIFDEMCKGLSITVASAIGNRPIEDDVHLIFQKSKYDKLTNKADILIATPGKLNDLIMNVPEFSLKKVQVLVIDEVDRILNSELEHDWINNLELSLYDNSQLVECDCSIKQNAKLKYSQFNGCCLTNYSSSRNVIKLLFSATLNYERSKLDNLHLFEPLFFSFSTVSISKQKETKFELPATLVQHYIEVSNDYKPAMIAYLMKACNYRKVLCFVGRKEDAHRLALLLAKYEQFNSFELSSSISAEERDKLKTDFSADKIDLIICTDILARGINLQDVNYVINYEPPANVQAHVHRVGRTARAGKKGTAITLVDPCEKKRFSIITRKTIGNRNIPDFRIKYDNKIFGEYKESYLKFLENLKEDVTKEKLKEKLRRNETVKRTKFS